MKVKWYGRGQELVQEALKVQRVIIEMLEHEENSREEILTNAISTDNRAVPVPRI